MKIFKKLFLIFSLGTFFINSSFSLFGMDPQMERIQVQDAYPEWSSSLANLDTWNAPEKAFSSSNPRINQVSGLYQGWKPEAYREIPGHTPNMCGFYAFFFAYQFANRLDVKALNDREAFKALLKLAQEKRLKTADILDVTLNFEYPQTLWGSSFNAPFFEALNLHDLYQKFEISMESGATLQSQYEDPQIIRLNKMVEDLISGRRASYSIIFHCKIRPEHPLSNYAHYITINVAYNRENACFEFTIVDSLAFNHTNDPDVIAFYNFLNNIAQRKENLWEGVFVQAPMLSASSDAAVAPVRSAAQPPLTGAALERAISYVLDQYSEAEINTDDKSKLSASVTGYNDNALLRTLQTGRNVENLGRFSPKFQERIQVAIVNKESLNQLPIELPAEFQSSGAAAAAAAPAVMPEKSVAPVAAASSRSSAVVEGPLSGEALNRALNTVLAQYTEVEITTADRPTLQRFLEAQNDDIKNEILRILRTGENLGPTLNKIDDKTVSYILYSGIENKRSQMFRAKREFRISINPESAPAASFASVAPVSPVDEESAVSQRRREIYNALTPCLSRDFNISLVQATTDSILNLGRDTQQMVIRTLQTGQNAENLDMLSAKQADALRAARPGFFKRSLGSAIPAVVPYAAPAPFPVTPAYRAPVLGRNPNFADLGHASHLYALNSRGFALDYLDQQTENLVFDNRAHPGQIEQYPGLIQRWDIANRIIPHHTANMCGFYAFFFACYFNQNQDATFSNKLPRPILSLHDRGAFIALLQQLHNNNAELLRGSVRDDIPAGVTKTQAVEVEDLDTKYCLNLFKTKEPFYTTVSAAQSRLMFNRFGESGVRDVEGIFKRLTEIGRRIKTGELRQHTIILHCLVHPIPTVMACTDDRELDAFSHWITINITLNRESGNLLFTIVDSLGVNHTNDPEVIELYNLLNGTPTGIWTRYR